MTSRYYWLLPLALIANLWSAALSAAEVHVAVAANFLKPLQQLQAQFEQDSGHQLVISSGSTGQLYAQIQNGAPFDVFLGADSERPLLTITHELGVEGSFFVYAQGRLVLWSMQPEFVDEAGAVLSQGNFNHLALANPKTAPYGAAAMEVLNALTLTETVQDKLVQGQSVTQTYQFIATGNAELGFVAFSQLKSEATIEGSYWLVDSDLYQPIDQGAVLLKHGQDNAAAKVFLEFLQSEAVKQHIVDVFGYNVP
jgi:molybdate transport system substrate-binding protein